MVPHEDGKLNAKGVNMQIDTRIEVKHYIEVEGRNSGTLIFCKNEDGGLAIYDEDHPERLTVWLDVDGWIGLQMLINKEIFHADS